MRKILAVGFCLLFGTGILCAQENDRNFEISKNLSVFNSLYKELEMFYVDTLDTEKTIRSGIDGMLRGLDPYTVYISDEETNDFKFQTTGEYAGVGAIITLGRDKRVVISEPYEGMPAQKSGLKAGDVILEIDGENVTTKTVSEVSNMLKGTPNTTVKIKVERPGEKKDLTFNVKRENIQITSVPYYGMVTGDIGYINLSSFTENTAGEVRQAIRDLITNHNAGKLILDVRNNPGGVMDAAVQTVNFFVPKGKEVVSTKGKVRQWNRVYNTMFEPIAENIPLVVLVNNNSASASEIVAGALQDLDRAVIVGSRTYGKGLVQSAREVGYNGILKLTISKYYIPSGRCIQAIDYTHRNESGSADYIPDSLTNEFFTANGRVVRDGRGISPDFTVENEKPGNITYYLVMENIIFDYATEYVNQHKAIPPVEDFRFTDEDYEGFKAFVKTKDFTYDRQTEKVLKTLREVAEFEGYLDSASEEFAALESKLNPDLDRDLEKFKTEIEQLISLEIVKRYYYQKGEIIEGLKDDNDLKKAIEVLNDPELYTKTLSTPVAENNTSEPTARTE
ncbi:MAG: S41 family peptidase [Candidatus Azobacteroides sp.]|nr:S41 family peptidase [Candidatus Azobacteroides sp.]